MTLEIERLTAADVDDGWRLSTQANWNQTRLDWHRLLELFPETCFAGRIDGEIVATSTLATYGDVGWIGMVLVDEAHRRRGYGSELFDRALEAGHDRGLENIGLDATDAGREVYRQYGFETVVGIDRWSGVLRGSDLGADDDHGADVGRVDRLEDAHPITKFDRMHVGVDRSPLLDSVIGADGSVAFQVSRDGRTRGYAVVRSGRTRSHVGPIVADDGADAAVLLSSIADSVDGSVLIDALRGDRTESLLRRFGLDVQRRLHRMTDDGSRSVLDGDAVVAAAGFEWG